jgi:phosphatidate cytidylyltransferase
MSSASPQKGAWAMAGGLGSRILFGIIMVAVTLGAIMAGPAVFCVLLLVASILVLREWFRMVDAAGLHRGVLVAGLGVAVSLPFALADEISITAAILAATAGVCFLIGRPERRVWAAAGVLYAGVPAVGLILLRNLEHGIAGVLLLFVAVWVTDTGAFVAGKIIGGPKLWPSVSPNKTWAGFFGGLLAAALIGYLCAAYFADWLPPAIAGMAVLAALVLSLAGQFGDLFESHMKRRFGVKDAGGMIPGHGGAMDRLDSITAAATIAGLCVLSLGLPRPHALPSASPGHWLGAW